MSENNAFDPAQFERYLCERIGGLEGAMSLQSVSGGQSNPTFFVSFANRRPVLRKKPAGPLLPTGEPTAMLPRSKIAVAIAGSRCHSGGWCATD